MAKAIQSKKKKKERIYFWKNIKINSLPFSNNFEQKWHNFSNQKNANQLNGLKRNIHLFSPTRSVVQQPRKHRLRNNEKKLCHTNGKKNKQVQLF